MKFFGGGERVGKSYASIGREPGGEIGLSISAYADGKNPVNGHADLCAREKTVFSIDAGGFGVQLGEKGILGFTLEYCLLLYSLFSILV